MDDKDTANKICNEMEEHCDNKEKLKVDEQIELQKKCTEQDSPCSSTTYEHNEEARNLQKKTTIHEKQKGVSMFATKKKSFDPSGQLRFDTYKKRSGTTDLGKDYEKLMCALFALKFSTSDIVADFEMKTNSDDCGDFDDVALKVTFEDGQSQIFLLQLKHSENMKNVNDEMFAAENGDFSLQKYMRSISKFENTENVSFILYTNKSTSIESKSTIDIKNQDKTDDKVVVTELQDLDSEKLLLWSKNENTKKKNRKKKRLKGTNVFQFELNQNSGSVESLDDYLKRFYFFAHQIDVTGAQSLINAILKKEYGITDATCSSSLVQFMETWWSSNFILTKYDVIAKLAELTLTPFIQTISDSKCNEKSKLLKEAIMKFDMTFVRDTNDEIVGNIWNETVSDEEISFTSLKYYGLRVEDLSPKESSKVLWHLNKVPLIVKAEECRQEQVKHAIRLLEKIKKKKVVLLANATKEEFPEWRIFQDLSDVQTEGVYTDIVKHFAVSLQGRQQIFLHQLLNFDHENARIIETTELIKMTQEVVQIGRRQENAFENYIPRSVSTISLDIKKMSEFCKKTGSLLIICNVSQPWNQAIRQLNLHVMEHDQYLEPEKEEELSKVDVLLTSNKWPHVRFDEICKKTKKNVHLLQVFDDKSCTSVLSKEKKFPLETMKSEGARVNEMEIFTYLDHPLNVICSPPGMGKSTLVSRLTSICPSSYWSVRVNLINHKAVFKNKCAHDEILHHFFEEEEDPLAVNIRSMLLQTKRMYFFLDGLDEIDSDCIPIALQFIQHISSLGHRVLITSRENLEQIVSHELNIFPIKIEELTEEQQREYIQERLQDFYQEDKVEHIINKIYENVDIVNSRHLLGIPLQLFMITENFLNNKNLWTESDQEIFVLTKMFKIFFQGKKKHQYRKLGMHKHEDQLGFDIDLYLEQYELLALKSCLDTITFDKLNISLERSQKFLKKLKIGDPIGIVSRVTDDNQAIFNHQTYAEYFACAWMKNNLAKVSLLQDDLFTKKNQNLRLIFDIMMAENSALHLAVIYRDTDLVSKHLDKSEVKDEGGRSPLQLLCTYGVEHPPLQINKEHISKEFYIINDIEEVSTQYREIFKMLSHCDVFEIDHIFQWTCLEFAIRLKNLFVVEKILERFGDSINLERLFECYDIGTLAIYSSQMGYPNLLGSVIKKESNVLSVKIEIQEITLLHVAVNGNKGNNKFRHILMEERKKVITTLIECGLDVDQQCNRKTTPLHFAANDDVIAKLLLDLGASINATDEDGQNALHIALQNSKVNTRIVKLLIDKGIDVNGRDCNQRTPLHYCCRNGHYDALVILLECGTNINAKDSMNRSPLYDAVSMDNYNCVKVLLDHGADINAVDNSGNTVLHAALRRFGGTSYDCIKMPLDHGADIKAVDKSGKTGLHAVFKPFNLVNDDNIKMLIDHGADINAVDNSGKTVLHAALESFGGGKYDCIKMLLDHGADINAVDNSGKTVLHAALESFGGDKYDCIKMLLDHGADIKAVDNSGKTVLHAAFKPFHLVNDDNIKMLIDHGADINAVDNSGKTVLHAALESFDGEDYICIKMLLDHGADINAADNSGKTVLHAAFESFDGEDYFYIKMLLDHGADINAVDNSGKTALHAAFKDPNYLPEVKVILLFLSRGVDANKRDKEQKTALDYAVTRRGSEPLLRTRYRQIVKIMFDATAYSQLMSTDYVTFLHYAVYDGNCVAVELFLENGLDLDNIDVNNQKYPLHFAVENGHLRSDLLLKITKLMRDYKTHCKKCFPKNDNILGILEEYVSNGYESFATTRKCLCQPRFDSYKKRNVTGGADNNYQKMMCVLFALKFSTSDIVADFEMKTNCDDCGDFNDVALKVTFDDGHSEIFLLQLKHSKNMKKVTEKNLAADFSLQKYIKSIREFENTENVSFILYTNSPTSIKNSSKIRIQNKDNTIEEIVVKELRDLDPKKLLLMNRKKISDEKEGTKVFQFEQHHSSRSVKDLDDSWKQLYFFGDQTNTAGARWLINATLRKECGVNKLTSILFVEFMETWWSGNFILTKYDVVAKLAELTLTPFIQTISDIKCNEKSKLLREAIMKFDMTIVRDTNKEVIANIWDETASDDEISLASLKYGLRNKWSKKLSPEERSKVLWHLNKVPLIVKAEDRHKEQVKHAIRLLEKVEKKKVVLLANATKDEFPGWRIFQDLSDLTNEGVYADISKHFAVSLQGQPPMFLDQLLNFDQGNDRTITTTELIKMTQEVVQIGRR